MPNGNHPAELETHAACSREFGADPRLVFLGGGNTSFKTAATLYIKPSGVALATIRPGQFVAMDRRELRKLFATALPADVWEREAQVKELMARSVRPAGAGRPSVEAPLHEVIPYAFVYHMHPALVNGMTCAQDGEAACRRLFPEALWIEYIDPGAKLAVECAQRLAALNPVPQVIFLRNHGVFVGADTLAEIRGLYRQILATLEAAYAAAGVPLALAAAAPEPDLATVRALAPVLRSRLGTAEARALVPAAAPLAVAAGPLTPDHIVYAKSFALELAADADPAAAVAAFQERHGYLPKVVSVPGQALFTADCTLKGAQDTLVAARDAALVQQLTAAFGGPRFLTAAARSFIENWEVESYRKKMAQGGAAAGRAANKVCVITGAAQGFGLGIAEGLAREGAVIVIADLNLEGGQKVAAELEARHGAGRALAVGVDISKEESVRAMVGEVVRRCGGLDLLVANAGVLRAGSVKSMSKADWDLVTSVNYTGYFLCVKHVAQVMAIQNAAGGPWTDIVQINSKSGLQGSNKNGAYAGSKFGAIGLTQSFALELVEDKIKVNSICPGNYLDGPLWSDPERGLFVQYLRAGKVAGATTIAEVRQAYEGKVPLGRGCLPDDVVRAILYVVEQQYETGQALPVTGGQVMR
ncbi:MAG: SDR family NAD(P)-dependent oxidoreductase [Lentisphaeria bacterium]|jgi:NAD(P)-dependent dehydrogenase (short-subunit alcohol dehydrogenase family)/rhamnose utilization protein RhaD (predicted bifunctional aldolase and dehydrogenase)